MRRKHTVQNAGRRIAEDRSGVCRWREERGEQRRGLLSERPLADGPSRSHEGPSEEDPGAAHHPKREGTRNARARTFRDRVMTRGGGSQRNARWWCAGGTGERGEQRRGLLSERPWTAVHRDPTRGRAKRTPA